MTIILYPSNASLLRTTMYNIVIIETDGYEWIFTHASGQVKKESRDNYPKLEVS